MAKFAPLMHNVHQYSGWEKTQSYDFTAADALAPISVAELSQLVPRYATAFYRADSDQSFQYVAILGLYPGHNLYVAPNGQWIGGYVPAVYRGYPFRILPVQESDKLALCIDEESTNFQTEISDTSERFFNNEGELSELMVQVKAFLQAQYSSRALTEGLIDLLNEYGLLSPWSIKIEGLPEHIPPHTNLYHINEKALKELDADKLKVLNLRGALSLAYGQMFSEHRMKELIALYDIRAKQSSKSEEINLDDVFGEQEDDLFKF
ncbi:SapC protein [Oceanospirillum multiglobuliferum]|uniref:Peptidase n=1 Tax=Oceanospirillum multiglobuliferum TaxID=64969 RepID=A0A1T4Q7S7_9GAMM|nr:SapC family protein [Oceanospirillum multiglobuliferum]OPX56584.1 hypothetical protein BTE48_03955 [Oceanospirillum multiglobuliferum]SJZ99812.1 SapC protein [Oceanospirillum multiglobuliferum]